jgi:hypothetical protein
MAWVQTIQEVEAKETRQRVRTREGTAGKVPNIARLQAFVRKRWIAASIFIANSWIRRAAFRGVTHPIATVVSKINGCLY